MLTEEQKRQLRLVDILPDVGWDRIENRVDFAYMAGILDGEGSIIIAKIKPAIRRRTINPQYKLIVAASNTCLSLLEWIQENFGGEIRLRPCSSLGTKPVWQWRILHQRAADFLQQVLPYLKIKDKQAEEAIKFQEFKRQTKRGYGRKTKPASVVAILEQAREVISEMNRGSNNVEPRAENGT